MKKLQRVKSISLFSCGMSLALGLFCAPSTYANDRIINVSGLILTRPCQMEENDVNVEVDFSLISPEDLMGNTTEKQDFEIKLTNCPAYNISTRFSGTATENNQVLVLASGSAASGAGIRIYEENGRPVIFEQATSSVMGGRDVTFKFSAQVTKLASVTSFRDIVAGAFSATATYEIIYN